MRGQGSIMVRLLFELQERAIHLQAALLGSPALLHELEQVREGFLVAGLLFCRQLPRAFVELRRHLRRFIRGTPQRHQRSAQSSQMIFQGLKSCFR